MPEALAMRIAEHSNRNARRALLTAEACRVSKYAYRCRGCFPFPHSKKERSARAFGVVPGCTNVARVGG